VVDWRDIAINDALVQTELQSGRQTRRGSVSYYATNTHGYFYPPNALDNPELSALCYWFFGGVNEQT